MLKKRERLTKKDFDRSFKAGKRYHSPVLQLIYDPAHKSFHAASVVGKKVYKKAVDRNRLRRQLYGAIYRLNKQKNLSGTYIIIAKAPAKDLSGSEVSAAVADLVSQVKS